MEQLKPEEIVALATMFSIELSKNTTINQLQTYRNFFQTVANNIQSIINEKRNI